MSVTGSSFDVLQMGHCKTQYAMPRRPVNDDGGQSEGLRVVPTKTYCIPESSRYSRSLRGSGWLCVDNLVDAVGTKREAARAHSTLSTSVNVYIRPLPFC